MGSSLVGIWSMMIFSILCAEKLVLKYSPSIWSKIFSIYCAEQQSLYSKKYKLERMKEQKLLIQTAVRAAEKRQITDFDLQNWLRELKDVVYIADGVLNSFKDDDDDDDSRNSSFNWPFINKPPRISDEKVKQLDATLEALEWKASHLHIFLMLVDVHSSMSPDDFNSLHRQLFFPPAAQTEISGISMLESDSSFSGPAVQLSRRSPKRKGPQLPVQIDTSLYSDDAETQIAIKMRRTLVQPASTCNVAELEPGNSDERAEDASSTTLSSSHLAILK